MTYTAKKTRIDKVKEIANSEVMEIRDDLEMFKTFDDNIGTGLIPDGRKFVMQLSRTRYVSTAEVGFPQNFQDGISTLNKILETKIESAAIDSW